MDSLSARLLPQDVAIEPTWLKAPRIADLPLESMPLIDVATLIAGARRAVIVAPHAENQVLGTGGLLVEFARFGLETHVICVTDGEASQDPASRLSIAGVRNKRLAETVQALEILGVDPDGVQRLRMPDGGVDEFEDELAHKLAAQLRPGDMVFTPCWDGHPDHAACNRAVEQAVSGRRSALRKTPVSMWSWTDPDNPLLSHDRAMRVAIGVEAVARKRRALALFESRLRAAPDAAGCPLLSEYILERSSRPYETLLYAPDV